MLENYPHLTSREISEEFGIHHTTVGDHIKSLGFMLKQSVWVPLELTKNNRSGRVRMCSTQDKLNTRDEKCSFTRILREKYLTANHEYHQQQLN